MSTVFEMLIGVTIVADAVAVAVACAKDVAENPVSMNRVARHFVIVFIFVWILK
jgi:hypothetical protein